MFTKKVVVPAKTDLEVALDRQNLALHLFEATKAHLDVSDERLNAHEEANSAELDRLRLEQVQIIAARERNSRVKSRIDEILA